MSLYRTLVCRLFHSGTYEESVVEERPGTGRPLRISTVVLRECATCGRELYRNDSVQGAR